VEEAGVCGENHRPAEISTLVKVKAKIGFFQSLILVPHSLPVVLK